MVATENGSVVTALAWGGDSPALRGWVGHELIAEHPLSGLPSTPCLLANGKDSVTLWLTVDGKVHSSSALTEAPVPMKQGEGILEDVAADSVGRTVLALRRGTSLALVRADAGESELLLDENASHASVEFDEAGTLHVAFEKLHGIEYCQLQLDGSKLQVIRSERVAQPFGSHPVLLAHDGRLFLAYLGESWPQSDEDRLLWESKGRSRRIGLGGYIAVLLFENGQWNRFRLADSKQFAKPLWSKTKRFAYDYPGVDARARVDLFSPPALTLGPDGVPHVFWANPARRWVYSSRFLGGEFSVAAEVRGPLEQLTGPCLLPKFVAPPSSRGISAEPPEGTTNSLPILLATKTRVYLDAIRLASPNVDRGRRIDFIQPDELAVSRGVEVRVNQMTRHEGNPVIRVSGPNDDGGISATVCREGSGWRAHILCKPGAQKWRSEFPATSADGIHWKRAGLIPEDLTDEIEGVSQSLAARAIRHIEDAGERNPAHHFKGLWLKPGAPWGTFVSVTSPDGKRWSVVKDAPILMCDEDPYIWRDEADVPERRFKATGNARSFCGRVCAQWSSPDGMHWNDIRATLDWDDPFGSDPYWCDDFPNGGVGRILVDPWSGPDDEEEIHGGFVFREGDRWLLHYMKWTPDGHILLALASSRDGINFTRVAGGAPTLPLGEPGTWDTGRIAIRNPPYLVNGMWLQHYTGSGWKHGFGGTGKRPHPSIAAAALASPMQMGLATVSEGHWTHLQLCRDSTAAELVTVPLLIACPHELLLDVDGLDQPGSSIACALLDATTKLPVKGFTASLCDPIRRAGQNVTWQGAGLETIGPRRIRLELRLTGHRLKLFGMNLRPM